MAEMGTTGVINITSEMCNNAIAAVETYEGQVTAIAERLDNAVSTLVANDFIGSAGAGYKSFYENAVQPIISKELTCTVLKLTQMIREMMDGLRQLLPAEAGTDDKLGEANVSAGNTEA